MPWKNSAAAILEMYLGGQAVGAAAADLLFGKVNPSGKLAETFPLRIEDTPCYLDYPGDGYVSNYGEGVFVGYRYYDTKKMDVLFPFGFGLSYTTFEITDLKLGSSSITDKDTLTVKVKVKNTGRVFGKETVQLYVSPKENGHHNRPQKELKGFEKISLDPGEEKEVSFTLSKRSFAYYETRINDWYVPTADYEIKVGLSSRDIKKSETVRVSASTKLPLIVDDYTTFGDVMDTYGTEKVVNILKKLNGLTPSDEMATPEALRKVLDGLPLHAAVSFSKITQEQLDELIKSLE
jgi:beta-glucosidase